MRAVFDVFEKELLVYLLKFNDPEEELENLCVALDAETISQEYDILQNPVDIFDTYKRKISDFINEEKLDIFEHTSNDPLCCYSECKEGVVDEVFQFWMYSYMIKEEIIERINNSIRKKKKHNL